MCTSDFWFANVSGFIYFSSLPWLKKLYAFLLTAMLTHSNLTPKIAHFFFYRVETQPRMSFLLKNENA
jgi:hypothetical protein